jgi:hypothetical protein
MLLDRLRKQLDDRGTLEVLRFGVDMLGLKAAAEAGPVQTRAGHEPGPCRPAMPPTACAWCGRCALGHDDVIDLVLFLNGIPVATAELKTDFTQDINDGGGPVPLRPHPPSPRASPLPNPAGLPARGAGALRRQQPHGDDDHQAARARHGLPALQPGRPWRGRQPTQRQRPPHRLPVGAGLAARQLAGDPRPLSGHQARQQEADHRHHLPALPPAWTPPANCWQRCWPRAGGRST